MSNTTATDEETIAQRRKRLRRVSFADREITSVHIFNRDEDDDKSNNTPESADKAVRFFGELADGDDTEGDCDAEDDIVTEKSFLRPRGSPSSGGSTIGSATSVGDDDNFFGPVSSHFINPGRFSDVTASEEHNDITMDSTAFSMHFRSLAMSGESVKTPTSRSSHLQVDELAQVSDTGSAMVLTGPKKFLLEPTLPDDKGSGGGDSNDMSIIGENSRKYDYGRISPRLAALLGEESNELLPASADNTSNAGSPNGCIPIGDADKDSQYGSGSHAQMVLQASGSQHYTKGASLSSSAIDRQRASIVGILPLPQPFSCFTPSPKQGGSFMSRGTLALGLIASSPGSALSQRIEKSKLQLSKLRPTPSTIGKNEIGAHRENHLDIPIKNLEDLLSKDDNRTPISEKKGTPDQHSCGAFNPAVDISDVFACTSPEGNTNSEIEGSLLKQQQRSQTASTPEKFASSPENLPNATTSALKSFVNLHVQEQHSEAIRSSETGDRNVTSDVFACTSPDRNTNSEKASSLKRKAEDVGFVVRNCSPRVEKSTHHISNPVMDNHDENSHANDCGLDIVCNKVMKWIEIPGKVSAEINQMIAPLADKLNSGLICKLEDILTHLKKVHLCEMLCLQIKSQKVCDELSVAKAKRRAETKLLLCKLAYEKAKLKFLHLKQEIMMKKYQAVSTGVQTSEILTLNCAKLVRQHGIPSTGLLNPEQSHEVMTSKGAELTEEVKILDSKIKNLIKCFPTCDEMTSEPSYADNIIIAEDNMQKKRSCRFIRQEIVVWEIDSLGENSEYQSIVLNYSGLINQRLTLKPGHASCVLISNRLIDNNNFVKNFPGMNVSVAFNSLFNADYSEKYVGGLLLEITQKTSLLVRNLLDVAEELQLARMERPNLVQGSFDSPSGEQLHLRISFIDCKILKKVTMILDVTCLIYGKYPGDVIPRGLVEDDGVDVSKQLRSEIESAAVDVGLGYPRILRLCNCISEVLRSQKK